ncbi:MAG: site-specific DNA-methyltransferase [Firmicutes bacterium]|nr:site-specific DNA-methyltransferase [Bacillota bacterium]
MEIIKLPINSIKKYENNAKIHTEEQIQHIINSIKQFGFNDPIGVSTDQNICVEGHGRLEALKQLGYKDVECIRLDHLTDEERRAYALVHNQSTMETHFDDDLLKIELDNIFDLDMSDFGFDWGGAESLGFSGEIIEDDIPDIQDNLIVQLGDVWQLGQHRLMCGNSTILKDVDKLMNGNNTDISFTSPPYNMGKSPSKNVNKNNSKYINNDDNMSEIEYVEFLQLFTNLALDYSEYCFVNIQSLSGNKIALIEYLYKMKKLYADTIIWDKQISEPAMGENILNSQFEYVHIFSKKANRRIGTRPFRGTINNILNINKQNDNKQSDIHGATFPLEFAMYFVEKFSEKSVFEPFSGSGTTIIACEQIHRKCYAMELEPIYCDIAIKRWENLTGNTAIKIE